MTRPPLTRPATGRGGRYRMEILTPMGWTAGRNRFRSESTARKSARWFCCLSEVRQVRVIDEDEDRVVFEFTNPRRKPR